MRNTLITLLNRHNSPERGIVIPQPVDEYVDKLLQFATISTYSVSGSIIAFIAYYNNDPEKVHAFLSMLLVDDLYQGRGLGRNLIDFSIADLKSSKFKSYSLEVLKTNSNAIALYSKIGFQITEDRESLWLMRKNLV